MSFKTNKFYAWYIEIITFLKTAWADWDHDSYEENAFIEKKKKHKLIQRNISSITILWFLIPGC